MTKLDNSNERFLRLYTQIQPKLYAFVLAVVHNRCDADEIFQETVLILWNRFDAFSEERGTSFGAWAIGIAKNKVLEYLRANKRKKALFEKSFYEQIALAAGERDDDFEERLGFLKTCMQRLKPSDHELVLQRFNHNQSVRHIAQHSGRSANSLYKTLTRILVSLRRCMSHQQALKELHGI